MFLLSAAVVCLKLLAGRTADLAPNAMRKTSPPMLIGTLVIVVAGTASSFQSYEPFRSVAMVIRIVWITLVWFWVLRSVCPNRETLASLLRGLRATVLVSCAGAIAGYLGFVHLTRTNNEDREAAFFNHPNELGGLLAMAVPLVLLGVLSRRKDQTDTTVRRVALLILVVGSLGTSGSMTAFLSCAAGVATVVALNLLTKRAGHRRFRTPLPYMVGVLALVGGLAWLSTTELPVVERFTELGEGDTQVTNSVNSREDLNSYVLNRLDNSLVIGVGLDSNTTDVIDFNGTSASRVHNMYLKLLYEAGVPSLVGLSIIMATTVRQGWLLAVNTRNDDLHPIVVGLLGSLVTMSVFAMFQPLFAQRYYWLPVGLIGVIWALRRQELRERDEVITESIARLT
ncbi:MAG TPA: O-antigen ligase family protein [Microthrixaceae bacterium]|nr:O-antigen ligase family protein [Microthrixaceae bacterium]